MLGIIYKYMIIFFWGKTDKRKGTCNSYPRNSETPPIPANLKGWGPSRSSSCTKWDLTDLSTHVFSLSSQKKKKISHTPLLQQLPDHLEPRKCFCNQHCTVARKRLVICQVNLAPYEVWNVKSHRINCEIPL